MILLDTCAIIFDALAPEQLSKKAARELEQGRNQGSLACSDISLWEIAMLLRKGRVKTPMPPQDFIKDVVAANRLSVLAISPQIAFLASYHPPLLHGDPADRIIAATALHHRAPLLTCDRKLLAVEGLRTVW
jgi:PIN domain nuclease of toxin-antitoxin system